MPIVSGITEDVPEIRAAERQASGSSFYSAMRILPRVERQAMYAIYAFCRAVDDIADDGIGTREERHGELELWRRDVEDVYDGKPAERASFLRNAIERFALRKEDFLAVIDGMEMDVAQNICAPDFATLDEYCDNVASAVGRLSIKVFGMEEDPGFTLAYHLGRALQLTNILRDLDEDAAMNRLYLPREALMEAGLSISEPRLAISSPQIDKACRIVAGRAYEHYCATDAILAKRPKGRLAAPRLMSAVYKTILLKMEHFGWVPPRTRIRIGKFELLMLVARRGLFG